MVMKIFEDFRGSSKSLLWAVSQLKGSRLRLLASCLLGVLRIALGLSFVYTTKKVVDVATGKLDGDIWHYITIMLVIMGCQLINSTVIVHVREVYRLRLANGLRSKMFQKVMGSRWNGKEAFHSGDTVNRLEEDIRVFTSLLSDLIPSIFISAVQLIAASVFLFTMQKNLLWVLLCIMPIAIIASKIFFRQLRFYTKKIRATDSEIQGHIQENLQNRTLVMSMGREEQTFDRLDSLQHVLQSNTLKRLTFSQQARVFVQMGFMAGYAVTFIWAVLGLQSGAVTYGMMTAFLQLVMQVQRPVVDFSHNIPSIVHATTSVDRLHELALLPDEERRHQHRLRGGVGVRIQNLCYRYPENETFTIKNLTHVFKPGTSTAIVGETGSGKSTLIRLILALLKPQEGKVTLFNDNEEVESTADTRVNFMYVPQGNSLLSGSIRENLLMGNPKATTTEMITALKMAAASFVFDLENGIDTECGEKGSGLSEGQAQRIAIARAMLQPGAVLILDEASSALDPDTERDILQSLSMTSHNKTIIWITHHLSVRDYMQNVLKL